MLNSIISVAPIGAEARLLMPMKPQLLEKPPASESTGERCLILSGVSWKRFKALEADLDGLDGEIRRGDSILGLFKAINKNFNTWMLRPRQPML